MVNKGLTETFLYFMKNIRFLEFSVSNTSLKNLRCDQQKAREVSGAKTKQLEEDFDLAASQ